MTTPKRKAAAKKSAAVAGVPAEKADRSGRGMGDGRARAVIDAVLPVVDRGRFAVKRIAGDSVGVEAHCFVDGHDKLRVVLRWQSVGTDEVYAWPCTRRSPE